MAQSKRCSNFIFGLMLLLFSICSFGKVNQTNGNQSPICSEGSCTINYNHSSKNYHFEKERVGKKLAIRSLFLLPFYSSDKCIKLATCKEFESAIIYLEVQSIWPKPFLLTASRVEIKGARPKIKLGPYSRGDGNSAILSDKITTNSNPSQFLIQPGETKLIELAQGIALDGVMDFFEGNVLDTIINTDTQPFGIYNIALVKDFNQFLSRQYGKSATLRISLFEKDYSPLLQTNALLSDGGDFFSVGDESRASYKFKHDFFIGEMLYRMHGGREEFRYRIKQPAD